MRRLLTFVENTAALLLLAIALLTAANVVLRKFFSIQIPDSFDLSRTLQAIAVVWGIAVTTYYGGHICVDALWEAVGARARRLIDIVATLVVALAFAPAAWMIWDKVATMGTQTTTDLRLPLQPFYAVAAAGATVAALLAVLRLVMVLRGRAQDFSAFAAPEA